MKLLFLCVANSARSQMAEGLAKDKWGDRLDILSAGSQPKSVHPLAIQVMAELGIDISNQTSKSVETIDLTQVDHIITLCAEEICPYTPGVIPKEHWSLPDPAKLCENEADQIEKFRAVRDELKQRINNLNFDNKRPSIHTTKT